MQLPVRHRRRRRFLVSVPALALLAAAAVPATAVAASSDIPRPPAPDWQRYVVAPPDRDVKPVRVLQVRGDVTSPDALLADEGGSTTLHRTPPKTPPTWPTGTTASASTFHAPNSDGDQQRTYAPSNAIDGDVTTFWNDDTIAAYPDVLTLTSPVPVTMPGITLRAHPDGVVQDATVETWDGTGWQVSGTLRGNDLQQATVPFVEPVTTTQVRITVTRDQSTGKGEFTRVAEVYPGLVDDPPAPSLVVDFGKVVVGYPRLHFTGASAGMPGVRLAFSESLENLSDRSDFTRNDQRDGRNQGTDQHAVPAGDSTWVDSYACQSDGKVCADGLHGFRYVRITLDALASDAPAAVPFGTVEIDGVSLDFTAYLGTPDTFKGWFESSDDDLNRYWYAAAYTNELTTDTFRATDVDPRGAATSGLEGKEVLQDGAKRDRDPYVGDIAVQGRTSYISHADGAPARNVLADLADHQRADGWIPPASISNYTLPLFDYPLWWVTASWDYVLYNGDRSFASTYYPNLLKVLDSWYPSVTNSRGLLEKGLNGTGGYGDYAFLPRTGEVTYYNVNYVRALRNAADLARWLGKGEDAARWEARADSVSAAVNTYLWDPAAGAYLDSAVGEVRHGQDGNGIAVVAGVADRSRASSALDYLTSHHARPWGNSFMDNDTLVGDGSQRVYAFTSYPELEARFLSGQGASAIEEIKRLYGWMYSRDPGQTFWEGIGSGGSLYEGGYTSLAHGWSTGVLPALSNYVLGVTATSPGFATWSVRPEPSGLTWARGQVPTPGGAVAVDWQAPATLAGFRMSLSAPAGTTGAVSVPVGQQTVGVRVDGTLVWDGTTGSAFGAHKQDGYVVLTGVPGGSHQVTLDPVAPLLASVAGLQASSALVASAARDLTPLLRSAADALTRGDEVLARRLLEQVRVDVSRLSPSKLSAAGRTSLTALLVNVLGTASGITAVQDAVGRLASTGDLSGSTARDLQRILAAAQAAQERGDETDVRRQLTAVRSAVEAASPSTVSVAARTQITTLVAAALSAR